MFRGWKEKQVGNYLSGRQRRFLLSGLLCLLLAGIYTGASTVAWFNQEIHSKNELTIGIFSTNATLTDPSVSTFSLRGRGAALGASASEVQPGFYRLDVQAVGNSSGYCLIYLKATTSDFPQAVYYSDQMGRSGEASYGYDLLINEPTSIRVVPVWRDMEGADPLRNDEYISYGRPPVVVKPEEEEEEQSEAANTESGQDASTSTPSADSASGDTASADSTPAASTGADSTTSASASADSTPSVSTSVDNTTSAGTPADSTPAVSTPADSTPTTSMTSAASTPADSTPSTSTSAESTSSADSAQ